MSQNASLAGGPPGHRDHAGTALPVPAVAVVPDPELLAEMGFPVEPAGDGLDGAMILAELLADSPRSDGP